MTNNDLAVVCLTIVLVVGISAAAYVAKVIVDGNATAIEPQEARMVISLLAIVLTVGGFLFSIVFGQASEAIKFFGPIAGYIFGHMSTRREKIEIVSREDD